MEVRNLNEYKYLCLEKEHLINDIERQKELLKKLKAQVFFYFHLFSLFELLEYK